MKRLFVYLAVVVLLFGCRDKIVEFNNDSEKIYHNDLLHGDLLGRVVQKESGAMVVVSQLSPVDSIAINTVDGSFTFRDLRAGNYTLTIRTAN
jgi:hypothetical protein